ncbi:MAG: class I SAM-dependent methyltransferase [Desulfobacterales bacterium]|nr:class I SAM-dependent methyltransferase [Desulfobacterales bacterium]
MDAYKAATEEEVQRINRLQRDFFSKLPHVFDPPLPEGVPERLEQIVATADIAKGDVVLDVGTGTGILVPLIQEYEPKTIFACDLSELMLVRLKKHYPYAKTIEQDVRDLSLPDDSVDVIFINACYPNIVDKHRSFGNISRMMKPGGRMVISHPMGKSFIDHLKDKSPFPLDDFPEKSRAKALLEAYGFDIIDFIDEPNLYVLAATKRR